MDNINKKIMEIEAEISGKTIYLNDFDKERTALGIVDMVNGFVYQGILASPRVANIVDNIVKINERTYGFKKFFFLDVHGEESKEFTAFPSHCIEGTLESELIPALRDGATLHSNTTMIPKNSTNGFFAPEFQIWLNENEDKIDTFIITGCVTDICILTFVLSLNTYFLQKNVKKRIIVPKNCVQTYDLGTHDGNLMNLFALYNMSINGIEIVENIE